jgi:hypothetical protein
VLRLIPAAALQQRQQRQPGTGPAPRIAVELTQQGSGFMCVLQPVQGVVNKRLQLMRRPGLGAMAAAGVQQAHSAR